MPLCHLCQHNQIDMRSVTDAGDVYFKNTVYRIRKDELL